MDATLRELNDAPFFDFGEDLLYPFSPTSIELVESEEPQTLRTLVRTHVPKSPGVYGMLDPLGRLIYVGKSKALRNRLLSYFLPNNEEDKAGRILQTTQTIVWETQPSEFSALLREQFLIRQFQPRFNVQGMPKRQQPIFICLGRQPAEQLYTARKLDPKAETMIGPLMGASRASRAVEVLNRVFLLRDCSSKQPCRFTDQLQLFDIDLRPGCIRLEIETCLGPCISACSRARYSEQVAAARSFLAGKDDTPIHQLEAQLAKAAEQMHFEQAAILRDDIRAVSWLYRRASDLAKAREKYTFVYAVKPNEQAVDSNQKEVWYLIRNGIIEGAIPAPQRKNDAKTSRIIRKWLAEENLVGSNFVGRPESLALVSSWFRQNRSELKNTFLPKMLKPKSRAKESKKSIIATKATSPKPSLRV